MRLLFIADGRSPTALNWISYFTGGEHEVHLVSLFPCQPELPLASLRILPVAFSGLAGERTAAVSEPRRLSAGAAARLLTPRLRAALRHWLAPLSLPGAARALHEHLDVLKPDLVHAMRIPYEGMLAALAEPTAALLVSTWGNDFTLHAPSTPWMRRYTRLALQRADALHSDCQRDVRLARQWGFDPQKPAVVLPGGGGLQLDLFYPPQAEPEESVVITPRGLRAYVRNDTFFAAAARVRQVDAGVRFICPSMAGEPQAQAWVEHYGLEENVTLLPRLTRPEMAVAFRRAKLALSISEHDGTPNTLLEAMACGCFPIAGDIESLREWIEPGVNGLLVDPADPDELAEKILLALQDDSLRRQARRRNLELVRQRAEYSAVMAQAELIYQKLVKAPL